MTQLYPYLRRLYTPSLNHLTCSPCIIKKIIVNVSFNDLFIRDVLRKNTKV